MAYNAPFKLALDKRPDVSIFLDMSYDPNHHTNAQNVKHILCTRFGFRRNDLRVRTGLDGQIFVFRGRGGTQNVLASAQRSLSGTFKVERPVVAGTPASYLIVTA